jgi:hypothetical protein
MNASFRSAGPMLHRKTSARSTSVPMRNTASYIPENPRAGNARGCTLSSSTSRVSLKVETKRRAGTSTKEVGSMLFKGRCSGGAEEPTLCVAATMAFGCTAGAPPIRAATAAVERARLPASADAVASATPALSLRNASAIIAEWVFTKKLPNLRTLTTVRIRFTRPRSSPPQSGASASSA